MTDAIALKSECVYGYDVEFSKSGFGVYAEIFSKDKKTIQDFLAPTKLEAIRDIKEYLKIYKNLEVKISS